MPLLHTSMHFPHIIHFFTFCKASFSFPRCNIKIICRKLTSVKLPAVHVAVHNPHAIQVLMSGLRTSNLLNSFKLTLSIWICELCDKEKPKSIISINILQRLMSSILLTINYILLKVSLDILNYLNSYRPQWQLRELLLLCRVMF